MSYILLPYFKNNPKTDSYFTMDDNYTGFYTPDTSNSKKLSKIYTIIVSKKDIFGKSTEFLSKLNNTTIYIYNILNLESITILNLKNDDNNSYTINVNLKYIPTFLHNSFCVLSTVRAPYSIDRTFTQSLVNVNRNNDFFTLTDSNTIIINKKSLSSDDTLFLYVLATTNKFNITHSNITYLIKDIEIDLSNINNNNIEFDAIFPILSLIDNDNYTFTLLEYEYDSKFFYKPFSTPKSSTPPVIVQPPNVAIELLNSVILKYNTDDIFLNNGNFKLESPDPTIVDLYSNIPLIEKFSTPTISPNINSNDSESIISKYTTMLTSIFKNSINNVKNLSTKYIINNTINPDVLPHIPIIQGNHYTLTLNSIDIFNKQINFIKQHSLLYLTNGKNTSLIATNTIPIIKKSLIDDNLIICNILFNNSLSMLSNNSNYVLSSTPVSPFVYLNYKSNYNALDTIENGYFAKLTETKFPQIILSNIDAVFNYNISSFNNVLYTLKDTSDVYLNILNIDYSLVCSLKINNVIPETHQTIVEYSIITGNEKFLNTLTSNTRYIFTLYSPSDFLGDNGIINTTFNMKDYLTDLNNLIQGAKISINNSHLLYLNNHNLLVANSIMEDVSTQSTILLNLSLTPYVNDVIDALLSNTYNALKKAMEFDPKNPSFVLINNKISTMLPNPVIYIILNNAFTNLMKANDNLTDIKDIQNINNCDIKLTEILHNFNSTKILNKNDVTELNDMLSNIILDNSASVNNVIYLIKTQKILQLLLPITTTVHTPSAEDMITINKERVLENFTNNQSSNHGLSKFIFSLIIFSIVITILITMSRK